MKDKEHLGRKGDGCTIIVAAVVIIAVFIAFALFSPVGPGWPF